MRKGYIITRKSYLQDEADNWLLMIPADRLSSDAKIVWLALKKIQGHDLSCMTDSNTWYKITGLKMNRVKECFKELELFGLLEQYWSTRSVVKAIKTQTFQVYLLDHFLMKGLYQVTHDCPHDGMSFPDPADNENLLRNAPIACTIKAFKESVGVDD